MEHFEEVEWVLDNFSCWNEEVHGKRIVSPTFTSFSPAFNFWLYPTGNTGGDKCVEVIIGTNVFGSASPPGELSFLCSDGSLIHSQQVEDPVTAVRGPRLEEVVSLIKEKEEDRLIVRFRFKSEEENKQKLRTVIEVIDNTLKIDPVALGCGKRLSVFPFQRNTEVYCAYLNSVRKGYVIQLQVECSPKNVTLVKTCVSFLKSGDVVEKYEEKEHVFRNEEKWVFFSINEKELAERGATVHLRLKIITGTSHSVPSPLTKGVSIVPNKSACFPEPKPLPSPIVNSNHTNDSSIALSKELMCLFQDQDFSDFQLKCGGVSLPVHKNILSTRSPVFKRLLCSDMREAASGSVDIEDLDAPTLARFLAFLYTGAVGEDLQADSALKLYYAADKYEVPTLKMECVKFLCANISLSNVSEILSLGDKHGDDELTEVSRSFILKNFNEVLTSENWKSFMKKEPLLAVETVTHFAEKNKLFFNPIK